VNVRKKIKLNQVNFPNLTENVVLLFVEKHARAWNETLIKHFPRTIPYSFASMHAFLYLINVNPFSLLFI
jgi:hypothetical protein